MQPHQERVIAEKAELDAKIDKLTAFLKGDVFSTLSEGEQDRMKRQHAHMEAYSGILSERIVNF